MTKQYAWYYDGVAIGGATSKTHTLTSGQTDSNLIECRVQVDYGTDSVAALAKYGSTFSPASLISTSGTGFNLWPGDTSVTTLYQEQSSPTTIADTDADPVGTVTCDTTGDSLSSSAVGREMQYDNTTGAVNIFAADNQRDLIGGTTFLSGRYSVFIAMKLNGANAANSFQTLVRTGNDGGSLGTEVRVNDNSGTFRMSVYHANAGEVLTSAALQTTTPFTFCWNIAASGDGGDFYIDNSLDSTYSANPMQSSFSEVRLASQRFQESNANIYGITLVNRRLTTQEMNDLQSYAESLFP